MVKFFSKQSPKQKFYLSSGHWLAFDVISDEIGVAAITDEAIQKDIANATRENRGGITEITAEEYQALQAQKKTPGSQPKKWREELGRNQVLGLTAVLPSGDPVANVAGAVDRHERVTKVAEAAKPTPRKK